MGGSLWVTFPLLGGLQLVWAKDLSFFPVSQIVVTWPCPLGFCPQMLWPAWGKQGCRLQTEAVALLGLPEPGQVGSSPPVLLTAGPG